MQCSDRNKIAKNFGSIKEEVFTKMYKSSDEFNGEKQILEEDEVPIDELVRKLYRKVDSEKEILQNDIFILSSALEKNTDLLIDNETKSEIITILAKVLQNPENDVFINETIGALVNLSKNKHFTDYTDSFYTIKYDIRMAFDRQNEEKKIEFFNVICHVSSNAIEQSYLFEMSDLVDHCFPIDSVLEYMKAAVKADHFSFSDVFSFLRRAISEDCNKHLIMSVILECMKSNPEETSSFIIEIFDFLMEFFDNSTVMIFYFFISEAHRAPDLPALIEKILSSELTETREIKAALILLQKILQESIRELPKETANRILRFIMKFTEEQSCSVTETAASILIYVLSQDYFTPGEALQCMEPLCNFINGREKCQLIKKFFALLLHLLDVVNEEELEELRAMVTDSIDFDELMDVVENDDSLRDETEEIIEVLRLRLGIEL